MTMFLWFLTIVPFEPLAPYAKASHILAFIAVFADRIRSLCPGAAGLSLFL